jgi:hypothetical protein
LIANGSELILQKFILLPRLSQKRLKLLIFLVERAGLALQLLVLLREGRLLLLESGHLPLQGIRILSAAG